MYAYYFRRTLPACAGPDSSPEVTCLTLSLKCQCDQLETFLSLPEGRDLSTVCAYSGSAWPRAASS